MLGEITRVFVVTVSVSTTSPARLFSRTTVVATGTPVVPICHAYRFNKSCERSSAS